MTGKSIFEAISVYTLTMVLALAAPKPNLKDEIRQFQESDALLNKTYKTVCASLSKPQFIALRDVQRDWIQYRPQKAEDLLTLNDGPTDKPTESAGYWTYMTDLTTERIEFLRVYSGTAVPKGISGSYRDFYDGNVDLKETKAGIEFSIEVIRGRAANMGEISGVAQLSGDKAVYLEVIPKGEDRKPCRITFTFTDGHIVKIDSEDSDFYHGHGAYFDGLYYKTK